MKKKLTNSEPKVVVIVGNIASGKSTATEIISTRLITDRIDADNLFQTTNPFREVYLAHMSRWAFTNELWLTIERVKLIKEHLEKTKSPLTIIDSGLLMSWVYTYSHFVNNVITRAEWELYEQIYIHFAGPVLAKVSVIRLQYDIPTLLQRLRKRGRSYELEFYTEEYLGQIEKGLAALEERIAQEKIPSLVITESVVPDFEEKSMYQDIFLEKVKTFLEENK